jgi:putative acetyltransferase
VSDDRRPGPADPERAQPGPAAPAWAVRPEQPGDAAGVRDLLVAAFGGTQEAGLVEALRTDPSAWLPALSLVAVAGGSVVGSLVLSRADVGGSPALALAPLAVLPRWQRRGVGSALVEEGLRRAVGSAERLVVVLGYPEYYARFGFAPARDLGVSGPYGDGPQFRALPLADPAPRGPMTYAAAFRGI